LAFGVLVLVVVLVLEIVERVHDPPFTRPQELVSVGCQLSTCHAPAEDEDDDEYEDDIHP
jgi:hypothetical protein